MLITVIGWIVLGLLAGLVGSKAGDPSSEDPPMDTVLGIIAAVSGGWLFHSLGLVGAASLNVCSLMVALGVAIVVLLAWHAACGQQSHARESHSHGVCHE